MTTILLARHGETAWNAENRFQGHADPPLNDRGRAQALALARDLSGSAIDALYSSPLTRAAETAAIVAAELRLPVRYVEELREIDVGEWQGLTRAEVELRFPEAYARWRDFGPGWEQGETYEALGERVLAALRDIAAAHPGDRVLAVTHGGPLRSALAAAAGLPHAASRHRVAAVANCAVAAFAVVDGGIRALEARDRDPGE